MLKQHTYKRIVNFYETDSAKIAHFSNFFRYVEEAEEELIESLSSNTNHKDMWFRNNFSCDFYKPIKFDDECTIDLSITQVKDQCICYEFHIHLNENSVAKGKYESQCLSADNDELSPKSIDPHLIHLIAG